MRCQRNADVFDALDFGVDWLHDFFDLCAISPHVFDLYFGKRASQGIHFFKILSHN